ncbi:MAG: hypothetical protein QXT05_02045 [Candidatus Bilamarchaeaceae archaeon]
MPDFRTVVPLQFRNFDAQKTKQVSRPHFDGGAPLMEFTIRLRNRFGEERKLSGLVPEGARRNQAIEMVIRQHGGDCIVKRGGFDPINQIDLSEFTWITHITLSDGFTMSDWIQIRNRNGEFEIGKSNGRSWWENGDTKRANRKENEIMLTEDFGIRNELPTTRDVIYGRTALQGCGGVATKDEIEAAKLAAKFDIARENYAVNLDLGEIKLIENNRSEKIESEYAVRYGTHTIEREEIAPLTLFTVFHPNEMKAVDLFYYANQLYQENLANAIPIVIKKKMEDEEEIITFANREQNKSFHPSQQVIGPSEQVVRNANKKTRQKETSEKQKETILIETILMRLLFNPVERRLYGKLYGLPSEENEGEQNKEKTRTPQMPPKTLKPDLKVSLKERQTVRIRLKQKDYEKKITCDERVAVNEIPQGTNKLFHKVVYDKPFVTDATRKRNRSERDVIGIVRKGDVCRQGKSWTHESNSREKTGEKVKKQKREKKMGIHKEVFALKMRGSRKKYGEKRREKDKTKKTDSLIGLLPIKKPQSLKNQGRKLKINAASVKYIKAFTTLLSDTFNSNILYPSKNGRGRRFTVATTKLIENVRPRKE